MSREVASGSMAYPAAPAAAGRRCIDRSLPRAVLFACTMNAVRSVMAAAILRHLAGQRAYVASAGVRAGTPDPFVDRGDGRNRHRRLAAHAAHAARPARHHLRSHRHLVARGASPGAGADAHHGRRRRVLADHRRDRDGRAGARASRRSCTTAACAISCSTASRSASASRAARRCERAFAGICSGRPLALTEQEPRVLRADALDLDGSARLVDEALRQALPGTRGK